MERDEQFRTVKQAIEHHIANNTKWDGTTNWGPWTLNTRKRVLFYGCANSHGTFIPDLYDIDLRRVVAVNGPFDTIDDWACHLVRKVWTNLNEVLLLVEALCSLYNAGMCGMREAE
jgi:hypothetical protein